MHIRDPEHGWATGQPGELSAVGGRLAFLCFGHLDTRADFQILHTGPFLGNAQ